MVLAGDSAGGHLAACTALTLDPEARGLLAGTLLIYPVVDHYSTPYASYVERDPLRDEGVQFAEQLRAAGVAVTSEHYSNAEHGFACSQGPTPDFAHFLALTAGWLCTL